MYCYQDIELVKGILTGYGNTKTCHLCIPINKDCSSCVYSSKITYGCLTKTFYKIYKAKTADKLLKAYKERAKYMRTILKEIENEKH